MAETAVTIARTCCACEQRAANCRECEARRAAGVLYRECNSAERLSWILKGQEIIDQETAASLRQVGRASGILDDKLRYLCLCRSRRRET